MCSAAGSGHRLQAHEHTRKGTPLRAQRPREGVRDAIRPQVDASGEGIADPFSRWRAAVPPLALLAPVVLGGCAPHGVTTQGRDIERLYNFFLAAAAVVWVVVTGLLLWSIVRYRRRGDELPPQIHGNNKLELTWTIIPTILVLVLFWATVQTQNRVTGPAGDRDQVQVHVLAFQWQWRFTYLQPGGRQPDVEVTGTPDRIPEL